MRLLDFYPLRGMLRPGETVRLVLEIDVVAEGAVVAELSAYHLTSLVDRIRNPLRLELGAQRYELVWQAPAAAPRGYGLELRLLDVEDEPLAVATSAIDVLNDWTEYPRYGFLTDFTPGRLDARETVERLARYHINGLQFYDWQYRHDSLLPPGDSVAGVFVDPLGRTLSLGTVGALLDAAHAAGMAGMPYLAVYAASLEYAAAHLEQRLYDAQGMALSFHDFLGLMDPTRGSDWARHLVNECGCALTALPFDGLHVDQYGEPKVVFNVHGEPVDLPGAFVDFITALKAAYPGKAAIFNAVGNWPIETLAAGKQDFLYIEIWPPDTGYRDVWEIVAGARRLSAGKPVVIALYLPVDLVPNVRLADAVILASGGTRIEIGERDRLLVDPYFPKHEAIGLELGQALRRYADFAVRFGEWLGPAAYDLDPACTTTPDGVWAIPRRAGEYLAVSLINTSGLGEEPHWDKVHGEPRPITGVDLAIKVDGLVIEVWWAAADSDNARLASIEWVQDGETFRVSVPRLDFWSMVVLRLAPVATDKE